MIHSLEGLPILDLSIAIEAKFLPQPGPNLHGEEAEQKRMNWLATIGLWKKLWVLLEPSTDGRSITFAPEVADCSNLVQATLVEGLRSNLHNVAVAVKLDSIIKLHPAGVGSFVGLSKSNSEDRAGNLHDHNIFGLLQFRLKNFQGNVLVVRVVSTATDISTLQEGAVTMQHATKGRIHIHSIPYPGQQIRSHGNPLRSSARRAERPVGMWDSCKLGPSQWLQHGVASGGFLC
mmetsp:Transcript_28769/g.46185  ORF Transcript_28769/g.46185 Transcript_28769/m.46185 type:complete len:233 (+) Transcript_28769:631-1329(+)